MPEDLWEAPNKFLVLQHNVQIGVLGVETELLQKYCELIVEEYEDDIERWFWSRIKHQTDNTLSVSNLY